MGVESVKRERESNEGTIPAEFIRSENEQPGITTVHGKVLEVPTIDFSDPDEEKLIVQITEASSNWGMYQIVNHDIPSEVISKLQAVGKEFFELPQEEKEAIAKPPDSGSIEGYGTKLFKEISEGGITKKGWVDNLFNKIWPPSVINYQFWPKNPPSYSWRFLNRRASQLSEQSEDASKPTLNELTIKGYLHVMISSRSISGVFNFFFLPSPACPHSAPRSQKLKKFPKFSCTFSLIFPLTKHIMLSFPNNI
ncbi:unnamed protein product [Malus baccata var. baccata]